MFNLKFIDWDAPFGGEVIPSPCDIEDNPGLKFTAMDITNSEDKVTEFCDCFFCTKELSDEQIMSAKDT